MQRPCEVSKGARKAARNQSGGSVASDVAKATEIFGPGRQNITRNGKLTHRVDAFGRVGRHSTRMGFKRSRVRIAAPRPENRNRHENGLDSGYPGRCVCKLLLKIQVQVYLSSAFLSVRVLELTKSISTLRASV